MTSHGTRRRIHKHFLNSVENVRPKLIQSLDTDGLLNTICEQHDKDSIISASKGMTRHTRRTRLTSNPLGGPLSSRQNTMFQTTQPKFFPSNGKNNFGFLDINTLIKAVDRREIELGNKQAEQRQKGTKTNS